MWNSHYFDANSSRVNFMVGGGVGYQFAENDWHVALRFEHVSNASLGERNGGFNAFGLAVG